MSNISLLFIVDFAVLPEIPFAFFVLYCFIHGVLIEEAQIFLLLLELILILSIEVVRDDGVVLLSIRIDLVNIYVQIQSFSLRRAILTAYIAVAVQVFFPYILVFTI